MAVFIYLFFEEYTVVPFGLGVWAVPNDFSELNISDRNLLGYVFNIITHNTSSSPSTVVDNMYNIYSYLRRTGIRGILIRSTK